MVTLIKENLPKQIKRQKDSQVSVEFCWWLDETLGKRELSVRRLRP
jgi:hypothetical protein